MVKSWHRKTEKMKSILFVVNVDWFFISHRLPIAKSLIQNGWTVGIACAFTGKESVLRNEGLYVFETNLTRNGTNWLSEVKYTLRLVRIFKEFKPDLVHLITIKPVIYGGFVSYLFKIPKVSNISGLGYGLGEQSTGIVSFFTWKMLESSMRLGKLKHFIFQNKDDLELFKQKGLLSQYLVIPSNGFQSAPQLVENYSLIKGVGIDLNDFEFVNPIHKLKIEIVFLGRLLKDKGILEFAEAARILAKEYFGKVVFKMYGGLDLENKMGINELEIQSLEIPGFLIWEGYTNDVAKAYAQADIVVFPSYREGLPKSLIEAAAIGRPIITTDVPGCKECVVSGYNGFLVPVKDSKALSVAIAQLIENEEYRFQMGLNSRVYCEKNFNVSDVIASHSDIYQRMI